MRSLWIISVFILHLTYHVSGQQEFQQRCDYTINVTLNDSDQSLRGKVGILYTNNSPDTLRELWFHLYPNALKNDQTAYAKQRLQAGDTHFYHSKSRAYIDSLDFFVGQSKAAWEYHPEHIDICRVIPEKPVLPGEKIKITTPFYIQFPETGLARFGTWEESWAVTQWYPKPAVYDENGWHAMPYLESGEFFSEYGSYTVLITLPADYVVAAPGQINREKPEIRDGHQIVRCYVDSVHDFAWFADKKFVVNKTTTRLPFSGREVNLYVYSRPGENPGWDSVPLYLKRGMDFLSRRIGEYPYTELSAVQTPPWVYGGMEYPLMIQLDDGDEYLEDLVVHEAAHQWFYGMLGFNEREHPWMDEGLATFYGTWYSETLYPERSLVDYIPAPYSFLTGKALESMNFTQAMTFFWLCRARNTSDYPINTPTWNLDESGYEFIAYLKGGLAFYHLKDYLGESDFVKVMHAFYLRRKFMHTSPEDLQKVFTSESPKDISWFFGNYLNSLDNIDYKIRSLKPDSGGYRLNIVNKGKVQSPFTIGIYNDTALVRFLPVEGFTGQKSILIEESNLDLVVLDPEHISMEFNRTNNFSRSNGFFRKIEPLKPVIAGAIDYPSFTELFFIPLAGWNNQNGLMPGMLLYNSVLPEKPFEFRLMPMYSLKNENLTGSWLFEFHPDRHHLKLKFFTRGQSYFLAGTRITALHSGAEYARKVIAPAGITIQKAWSAYSVASDFLDSGKVNHFIATGVILKKESPVQPWEGNLKAEAGNGYLKMNFEFKGQIIYPGRKRGFSARFFFGYFVFNENRVLLNNYRMGGMTGMYDYKFDESFLDRAAFASDKNLFSAQFLPSDGGFCVYNPLQSNEWLTSLNLKAAFPVPVPFGVYFNTGTYAKAGKLWPGAEVFPWEAGIECSIIPDIFAVYFPVIMSPDLKRMNELVTDTYFQKVRFVLNINQLNPFLYREKILKEF